MTFYPFFLNLQFEGPPDEATPFTGVQQVDLGFIGNDGIEITNFFDWHQAAEWVRGFQRFGKIVPVGYNLRNLVWPAFTLNMVLKGEPLPGMMMPMDRKWNDMQMIDLQQLLVQGGYSDWKPTLAQAMKFFGIRPVDCNNDIVAIYELYKLYQKVS